MATLVALSTGPGQSSSVEDSVTYRESHVLTIVPLALLACQRKFWQMYPWEGRVDQKPP